MEKRNHKRNLPDWIKIDFKHNSEVMNLKKELRKNNLHTVCEEAKCPNLSECFGKKKTATFMIMGDKCSRNCAFCNITYQTPERLDSQEPCHIAEMVKKLGLNHVVITSVTRDDLPDGGSSHFAETIKAVRGLTSTTIEVLTPDFKGKEEDRKRVSDAKPDIYNHNVETVQELYQKVRPQADYKRSIDFLKGIKRDDRTILTKSGIMVGLGETEQQLKRLLQDLSEAEIDIFTCGQYLRPSKNNIAVEAYLSLEWFDKFTEFAKSFGLNHVYASPFTRSSYNAAEIISSIRRDTSNV
ncbi:MAG: lipoyl synthase [Candidatus Delongbacteria bacterium]|nr:lipoyl synthase [Candidatus Delongbacteria bacterium]MCG2759870.1 lipoyl synthase [Candidatus Delongbacteria bacterium]